MRDHLRGRSDLHDPATLGQLDRPFGFTLVEPMPSKPMTVSRMPSLICYAARPEDFQNRKARKKTDVLKRPRYFRLLVISKSERRSSMNFEPRVGSW